MGRRALLHGPMGKRSATVIMPARSPLAHAPSRDVFVYFDNDAKVFAPKDAQALAHRVDKLLAR